MPRGEIRRLLRAAVGLPGVAAGGGRPCGEAAAERGDLAGVVGIVGHELLQDGAYRRGLLGLLRVGWPHLAGERLRPGFRQFDELGE